MSNVLKSISQTCSLESAQTFAINPDVLWLIALNDYSQLPNSFNLSVSHNSKSQSYDDGEEQSSDDIQSLIKTDP